MEPSAGKGTRACAKDPCDVSARVWYEELGVCCSHECFEPRDEDASCGEAPEGANSSVRGGAASSATQVPSVAHGSVVPTRSECMPQTVRVV